MKKVKRILVFSFIILVAAGFIFLIPFYLFLTDTLKISPLKVLTGASDLTTINKSVNVLVLGIPGGSHEGPNLSDSINVVHYNLEENKITVIGIPRDVWSDTLQDKINSAYSYGEEKQKGGGLKLAKAEASGVIGMPVPYGIVISFDNFKTLIDNLGGIDVTVERTFSDQKFPVEGNENDMCGGDPQLKCRYKTLTFQKGLHQMDGSTALSFVRSRHAEGDEGSDFARNRRQQIVMDSILKKIIVKVKSMNIGDIKDLYLTSEPLFERDISNQELAFLAKNALFKKNIQQKNIPLPLEIFEVPDSSDYFGKYVLIPKDNNPELIKKYIACAVQSQNEEICRDY